MRAVLAAIKKNDVERLEHMTYQLLKVLFDTPNIVVNVQKIKADSGVVKGVALIDDTEKVMFTYTPEGFGVVSVNLFEAEGE